VLAALRAAGVRLSVDDYGSAGAPLSTLRELPLDALKIDPAHEGGIGSDGGTDMVAAIIHLARALGLSVLAQGVESDDQLAQLREFGCDQFQGPLLGEQLTAPAMLDLLRQAGQNQPKAKNRDPNPATPSNQKKRGSSR
jgi:EAL domain-containing protein (putative c-di-GMP-specific phosphodiesterase class I)